MLMNVLTKNSLTTLVGLFFYNTLWYKISFQVEHPVIIFVSQGWAEGDLRENVYI